MPGRKPNLEITRQVFPADISETCFKVEDVHDEASVKWIVWDYGPMGWIIGGDGLGNPMWVAHSPAWPRRFAKSASISTLSTTKITHCAAKDRADPHILQPLMQTVSRLGTFSRVSFFLIYFLPRLPNPIMQRQLMSLWTFLHLVTNPVSPFDFDHPFSSDDGGVRDRLVTRNMERRDDLPNVPSVENFVRRAFHACESFDLGWTTGY